jgi:hypothetical protein
VNEELSCRKIFFFFLFFLSPGDTHVGHWRASYELYRWVSSLHLSQYVWELFIFIPFICREPIFVIRRPRFLLFSNNEGRSGSTVIRIYLLRKLGKLASLFITWGGGFQSMFLFFSRCVTKSTSRTLSKDVSMSHNVF